MKRWIVNAREKTVREVKNQDVRDEPIATAGEFFCDAPTYADAMGAGQRRRLAEEALRGGSYRSALFTIVMDRLEPVESNMHDVATQTADMANELRSHGFDVWREGTGLVVLGRVP